ncbi:hypothetical protein P8C59_009183 [Phyllachora maydis]|uniref:RNase H type-1 domain-containing protein n=1 Tax=Phyllachora maydis TaxID=1825666 RepID=A0AAD9ID03_9PEZI|nr:hypothetical protein P8C59_009183 [Phyllachora maydis]
MALQATTDAARDARQLVIFTDASGVAQSVRASAGIGLALRRPGIATHTDDAADAWDEHAFRLAGPATVNEAELHGVELALREALARAEAMPPPRDRLARVRIFTDSTHVVGACARPAALHRPADRREVLVLRAIHRAGLRLGARGVWLELYWVPRDTAPGNRRAHVLANAGRPPRGPRPLSLWRADPFETEEAFRARREERKMPGETEAAFRARWEYRRDKERASEARRHERKEREGLVWVRRAWEMARAREAAEREWRAENLPPPPGLGEEVVWERAKVPRPVLGSAAFGYGVHDLC